jgi:hypothetical protein
MAVLPDSPTITQSSTGARRFVWSGGACGADDTIEIATGGSGSVLVTYVEVTVTGGGITRVDPEFHKVGTGLSAATRRARLKWASDDTPTTHVDGATEPFVLPVDTSGKVYLRPKPDGTGTAYSVTIVLGGGR